MSEADALLRKHMMVINVVWGAILASLGVYVLAMHMVDPHELGSVQGPDFPLDIMKNVLYAVSGATLVITGIVRRAMTSPPRRSTFGVAEQDAAAHVRTAAGRYQAAIVVSLALAESIGIYGVVLYLMGAGETSLYVFILVSAAAMVFFRPKRGELEEMVRQMKGRHPGY